MNSPWEGVSEKASWRRCYLTGAQKSLFQKGRAMLPGSGLSIRKGLEVSNWKWKMVGVESALG